MEKNKYQAFTLLEMLVVMGIMVILGGMTFASFDGLQNTIKMNEYMLNLEQDIRGVQRASMLLERNPTENWLYGIGIDFADMNPDGNYTTFKWCTTDRDYGDITTTSKVPGYDPSIGIDSASLPLPPGDIATGTCGVDVASPSELRRLYGYETTLTMPKSNVTFGTNARFVVFESVSGRAFFYADDGRLLNYRVEEGRLLINDNIEDLVITIDPFGGTSTRRLIIKHLSGRIDNEVVKDE
jgi:prepilin-type N-terminal cleavage/methylation domain-containing protein